MYANERLDGVSARFTGFATVSVTVTLCGLFAAPLEVRVTVPVYVPAANPAGLTETLTFPGVVPPPDADNHVAPDVATV
jgi:hypothetical protein